MTFTLLSRLLSLLRDAKGSEVWYSEVTEEIIDYIIELSTTASDAQELGELLVSLIPSLYNNGEVKLASTILKESADSLAAAADATDDDGGEDESLVIKIDPSELWRSKPNKKEELEEAACNADVEVNGDGNLDYSTDPVFLFLSSLAPTLSMSTIRLVLEKFGGNQEASTNYILDTPSDEVETQMKDMVERRRIQRKREAERKVMEEEKMKRNVLSKFDEVEVREDYVFHRPDAILKSQMKREKIESKKKQMYRDDVVVSRKGEKFVLEKKKEEDPSTFISLKVVHTKRKGGKGFR